MLAVSPPTRSTLYPLETKTPPPKTQLLKGACAKTMAGPFRPRRTCAGLMLPWLWLLPRYQSPFIALDGPALLRLPPWGLSHQWHVPEMLPDMPTAD